MNLSELIDYVGNLVDYDPLNSAYRAQLTSLLNEAQVRILSDRPWTFAQRDRNVQVWTDTTLDLSVVNGSSTVAGVAFPVSASLIKPGSNLDGSRLEWVDSAGVTHVHTLAWIKNSNTLFLDRDYEGVTGTYTATVKRREIYLPSDSVTVQNISDPTVGIPQATVYLSKFEEELGNLDPNKLGRIEAFLMSQGKRTPAPARARGVSVVAGVGQGVRTINVYMVNVLAPFATNAPMYRPDVSDGFESGFSQVASFELSDLETLRFTPEVVPSRTGLYRRYYFTCPEAGVIAPVRVRSAGGQGVAAAGVDTVNPEGTVTLAPDLSLATLEGQSFQATSVRYVWSNAGAYQAIRLYPHPGGDQAVNLRVLLAPTKLQEDQDQPLIPESHSQIIAVAALESLAMKVANPALAEMYARKKAVLYSALEQAFLERVPRRIVKGDPIAGSRFAMNPYGPLKLVP